MTQERKVYPSFVDFKKGAEGQSPFGALVGFVARDPQQNTTNSGKAVVNTAIPVNKAANHLNYVRGSKFDENSNDPIFIEITGWEKQAELVEKSGLAKGDQVVVSGYLALEEYEGKERIRLNVSRFNILRRKNAGNNASTAASGNSAAASEPEVKDDLPF